MNLPPPKSTLFPYTTLFRSKRINDDKKKLKALPPKKKSGQWIKQENALAGCRNQSAPFTAPSMKEHLPVAVVRSEEHTSELQSRVDLVCRLLLEKKKNKK